MSAIGSYCRSVAESILILACGVRPQEGNKRKAVIEAVLDNGLWSQGIDKSTNDYFGWEMVSRDVDEVIDRVSSSGPSDFPCDTNSRHVF